MSKSRKVLLGVCPIGKTLFSHEDALRQKRAILGKLDEWNVEYCTIDAAVPDGMVREQKHVGPVVDHLKSRHVDALFMPHCNFGTEGAVGMIGKKLGVPVLLWGPRDEAPLEDGSRYRDSLCGMFASSKVLVKLGVPFTYVENCRIDDPQFRRGLETFVSAAAVAKAMRSMRIGQVGVRVDFFWTTIDDESDLLQRFGIEVLPFDMADFLSSVRHRADKDRTRYAKEADEIAPQFSDPSQLRTDGTLRQFAMRDELLEIAAREEIDAFSIKTFTSIQSELGPGIPLGEILAQEELPIAPESDIHGAISSVLLGAASRTGEPTFVPEFTVRHPENDNGVLLWHAAAPLSLKHPDIQRIECKPAWILKGLPGAYLQMRLKDGPLTVCRFDGDSGDYRLGIGEGRTIAGPATREIYAWMEVDDWPRWERRIMHGPYIHHCSAVHEHCADALEEACRFIPGLTAQRFDGECRDGF